MGADKPAESLFCRLHSVEKEAVFPDVLCPLHHALRRCFDTERKQKLVPGGTVLHTSTQQAILEYYR